MRIKILPYKRVSNGAINLARAMREIGLDARKIRLIGRAEFTYQPRLTHIIINWGNSTAIAEELKHGTQAMLNKPEFVRLATNKKTFFEFCAQKGIETPEFTTDKDTVKEWLKQHIVVARTVLTGHSGEGIEIMEKGCKKIVSAPLYTKYEPKKDEFRIHVLGDKIIDAQQKRLSKSIPEEERNYKIRSHDNGWVFCRENVTPPRQAKNLALKIVKAMGLDFGAVDIGYNHTKERALIYEVNTAPGLQGTTLNIYAEQLKKYINDKYNNNKARHGC